MMKNSEKIMNTDGADEPFLLGFLKPSVTTEVHEQEGRRSLNMYESRCNLSLFSNYILYFFFIAITISFLYFAVINSMAEPCYANYLSNEKAEEENGKDIKWRFQTIFIIGSICGLLELVRNTANLLAKCFKYMRLAVIFQYLGFITAFLFLLNFILMHLYRLTALGAVCSGDLLQNTENMGLL